MQRRTETSKMNSIAHEVAHYVLGHDTGGFEHEKEADDHCQKWGFAREYSTRALSRMFLARSENNVAKGGM